VRNLAGGIWVFALLVGLAGCGFKTNPRPATATIPSEVESLNAYAYPHKIVLKWDVPLRNTDGSPFTDISGFKVFRRSERIGEECQTCVDKRKVYANVDFQSPVNAVIEKGEVVYTDRNVTSGLTYSYSVAAYNLKGREGKLGPELDVVFEEPPAPPGGLRARVDSKGVHLEWEGPMQVTGVKNYRVYRGTTDDPDHMKAIGGTANGETSFLDNNAQRDATYYYNVRSFKTNRGVPLESVASFAVKVHVPSVLWDAPEDVTTLPTREGITVGWLPVKIEKTETRYNLYRSESGKIFERINKEPLVEPKFTDRKVVPGKVYRYAVTAFPKDKPEDESSRAGSEAVKFSR